MLNSCIVIDVIPCGLINNSQHNCKLGLISVFTMRDSSHIKQKNTNNDKIKILVVSQDNYRYKLGLCFVSLKYPKIIQNGTNRAPIDLN